MYRIGLCNLPSLLYHPSLFAYFFQALHATPTSFYILNAFLSLVSPLFSSVTVRVRIRVRVRARFRVRAIGLGPGNAIVFFLFFLSSYKASLLRQPLINIWGEPE